MATKSTNRTKATCWTLIGKLQVEGSTSGVIAALFWEVNGKAKRAALLAELVKVDKKKTLAEEKLVKENAEALL